MARIERGAARLAAEGDGQRRHRAPVRRTGVGLAVVGAMALGLREVFDPPDRVEIEEVDPWEERTATADGVRFDWHADPPRSVARIPVASDPAGQP